MVVGGTVVVVVVVVAGGGALVVVVTAPSTVVVVAGACVTGGASLAGGDVGGTSKTELVVVPAGASVVDVVGGPMATGVSTTRSRIPATAAEAMITESAVATSHAAPKPMYLFIRTSMQHPAATWVNRRLNHDQGMVHNLPSATLACKFPPMASVLLIEDDQRIRQALATRLAERGHDIESTAKAMEGVEKAVGGDVDIVVLDLGLPDVDGAEALRMIRAVSEVPVIVATARDDQDEIVKIFDAGADDYVIKPYSTDHLEARIRALLRRAATTTDSSAITIGELRIDTDAHEATLAGEDLELSAKEFELLAYLAERPGKMVGKRELLAAVWRQPYGGADKTVDVHLSWLRKKLGETAAEPRYIHTRRGVGVKLVDPGA